MKPLSRLLLSSKQRIHNPEKFHSGLVESFARSCNIHEHPLVAQLLGNLRSRSFGSAVRVAASIGSQSYANPADHFAMNQLASLVKKVPFSDPSLQPETTAWGKFLAAEHSCKRTNQRLKAERKVGRERHSSLRAMARAWIVRVIGQKPDLPSIYALCDYGPGASIGVHGNATHKAAKLCAETWTCTAVASCYARSAMVGDYHIWEYLQNKEIFCLDPDLFWDQFASRIETCNANKIIMVPKTATVHRTIAIEPLLNGYVQKGVDQVLRKKLLRVGLDLSDQSRNQHLAMLGSAGGFNPFSTIDLSAASDSLSIETVRDLLPPDWFDLLNDLRSPNYESEWGNGRYHKFSSMGNGFCFPLETLIFASIAYACGAVTGDSEFRVYGDDIIVRQRAALLTIEVLKYYGFSTNTDKTFIIGPFRESCGADYFQGINVRPYSLDFIPATDRDIYKIANGLRTSCFFVPFGAWDYVVKFIPYEDRLCRPYAGPPDTALDVPLDVFMSSKTAKWCHGIQDWTWVEYVSIAITDDRRAPPAVQMYGLLRGQRASQRGDPEFALRRKTRTSTRFVPSRPVRAEKLPLLQI